LRRAEAQQGTEKEELMSKVFVLDTNKHPLNPVHPGRARILLRAGQAAVYRRFPFCIILKTAVEQPQLAPLRLKIDPGSTTSGLTLVNDATGEVVWAAELTHRGEKIKQALEHRRAIRRFRRSRKTRYRPRRFLNRRSRPDQVPPSLDHRVATTLTWVGRLRRLAPVTALSQELVKFDTQAMQDATIQGVKYQQGTLARYEVRSYLLEKWGRACVYCAKQNVPLQVEHVQARARGGSHRISNLVLSCQACNLAKGTKDVGEFLAGRPELLARIQQERKRPLADAAAVNTTRWRLFEGLKAEGLPLETGSGGLTSYNRAVHQLPKRHWLDAALVGVSTPEYLSIQGVRPLLITARGHGNRQMCGTNKVGLPIRHRSRQKHHFGMQSGDIVRAVVPVGKRQGRHLGRVLCRASGSFDVVTSTRRAAGISHRYCTLLWRQDGYSYAIGEGVPIPPPNKERLLPPRSHREGFRRPRFCD